MSSKKKISEIYVRGYSRHVQKDKLKDMFRKYGQITSIRFKGHYSFIVNIPHQEFKDCYDAEKAVDNMHNKRIEGCKLIVQPAQTKRKNYKRYRSRSRSRSGSASQTNKRKNKGQLNQNSDQSSSQSSQSSQDICQKKQQKRRKKSKNRNKKIKSSDENDKNNQQEKKSQQ